MKGPFNVVAPGVVRMNQFCAELGTAMNRWSWAHVPGFAVKLILGEVSDVTTSSIWAVPQVLQDNGFVWKFPNLSQAIPHLLEHSV